MRELKPRIRNKYDPFMASALTRHHYETDGSSIFNMPHLAERTEQFGHSPEERHLHEKESEIA